MLKIDSLCRTWDRARTSRRRSGRRLADLPSRARDGHESSTWTRAVETQTAAGRATSMTSHCERDPGQRDIGQLVREHKQAEQHEQADLGDEGRHPRGTPRAVVGSGTVCFRRRARRDRRPGIHSHRACLRPRTRARPPRSRPPGRRHRSPPGFERRPRLATAPRVIPAMRPMLIWRPTSTTQIAKAVRPRVFDPRDQAEGERDRHRIVASRLSFERPGQTARDVSEREVSRRRRRHPSTRRRHRAGTPRAR